MKETSSYTRNKSFAGSSLPAETKALRTDPRTDGPTDRRTYPLIESWLTTKNVQVLMLQSRVNLIGRLVQGGFINDLWVFECREYKNLVEYKIGVKSLVVKIQKIDFYFEPLFARLGISFSSSRDWRFDISECLSGFVF